MEHTQCLRRWAQAAISCQWLEEHGRLRYSHWRRDLASFWRRRLSGADAHRLERPHFPDERAWPSQPDFCGKDRRGWRHHSCKRSHNKPLRSMEHPAWRSLYGNAYYLRGSALLLSRRLNSFLLRSGDRKTRLQRTAWEWWRRVHGFTGRFKRKNLLCERARKRFCGQAGGSVCRPGNKSAE